MTDFMTLHASEYPPSHWPFLAAKHQPKPSQPSKNELWAEMTRNYEWSMAERQRLITSNFLSETATDENIDMMRSSIYRKYRRTNKIAFEDAADVLAVLEIADGFVRAMDELSKDPLETIPEEDDGGTTRAPRRPTEMETLQICQVTESMLYYEGLSSRNEVERSFQTRLEDIIDDCRLFIRTPVGNHPRPRWAELCRMDREVAAQVAWVQGQVASDVAELRDLLRRRLFDQYCLMRDTPAERNDETLLIFGQWAVLGSPSHDARIGERLHRMLDASGLDPDWVMGHLKDYYAGNERIGQWQRYMQGRCWKELAAKLSMDMRQLEQINSTRATGGRRCNIMFNICNTKRQFFSRLVGAQDYDLSERALRMEEGYESSLTLSSVTLQVTGS